MQDSEPAWPLPPGVRTIDIDGYPMAWREEGAGPPLVLVHGSFSDYRYWAPQVAAFAEKRRTMAVSLRRYFPEPWDGKGDDFSFRRHADDVAAFIRKLGLGKVALLGHSRGGAVVLEVAKRHPDVVGALILSDASARLELAETEENRTAAVWRDARFAELRAAAEAGDARGGAARFLDQLMGAGAWDALPASKQQEMLDNLWTAVRDEPVPSTSDADLRRFDFPILILLGEKSPPMYAVFARAMREKAGFPEPVVIRGAGHAMNVQKPTAYNAAVLAFLDGR
ncbi:MAG: alpha/beta hydrolase [Hyphomicrobiales bacterium]|nr:alpha/beta hydrolase [Hyphomicrobiales bacterium]